MGQENSATLTVNLAALRANYHLLRTRHEKRTIAAVVKANAYGLGVERVSQALADEGCELFFVATVSEAIELRNFLPHAKIAVFNGIFKGEEKEFAAHHIIPVVNDLEQLDRCQMSGVRKFFLHIDTGMTRLGLSHTDLKKIPPLSPDNCQLVISHLACASEPAHPKNNEQLSRLRTARQWLPDVPVSFANSSGLFLGTDYHFDIGRPGCALYGINPISGPNPMQPVATLSAPIIQIRTLDCDEEVGYGSTCAAKKGSRLAVAGMGYADGFFRLLGHSASAFIGNHRVPIAGRISMDMVTLDISHVPESALGENPRAEFINAQQTVDDIATQAHTIGYEIFTRIGRRVIRNYC